MEEFDANFFTLLKLVNAQTRGEIESAFTTRTFAPHEIIYEQGTPSDSVYIVASGVVEAITASPDHRQSRSVAYMERGDFFGDLGVLTGQPRLAGVRSCEQTEVLHIEKNAFLHLLEKIPQLSIFFTRNIARRLHRSSTLAHLNVFSLDLTGNLQYFDLLTIVQAITNTGRSGELLLNSSSNDLLGSFFFRDGHVEHARFLHLEGIEAVWQGFVQSATDGTFTFKVVDSPTLSFAPEQAIGLENTSLLLEGAGKRDVYQGLPEELRLMGGKLGRRSENLQWPEAGTLPIAERVWELMARRPQPLDSLWRRLSYSSVTFLEVVQELIETGQADFQTGPETPITPA